MKKLKKINKKLLTFGKKYTSEILGILGASTLGVIVWVGLLSTNTNLPKSTKEFYNTSVMVLDLSMSMGGSGVVLRSTKTTSEILTNKHVCRLVEGGGFILYKGEPILIDAIKKYNVHDLCLVRISKGLGVNTKIAEKPPEFFSKAYISGHPALLPHVLTVGNFSGFQPISLVVGLQKCDKNTKDEDMLACSLLGGVPVIETFRSQLVTGTILPGSSGSATFNEDGEISGMVFAGQSGGLNYAFVVPYEYVYGFLSVEKRIPYTKVSSINYSKLMYRIFNAQKVCEAKNLAFCKRTIPNSIEMVK